MKKLTLIIAVLLSLSSYSQCEYDNLAWGEVAEILDEEWDFDSFNGIKEIKYRKYIDVKERTIESHFVDGCEWKQENKYIEYADESISFQQHFIKFEDCSYELGDKGEYVVYLRTYTLPETQIGYDEFGEEEIVDNGIIKVIAFSDHEDFRTLYGISFYKNDKEIIHSDIYP